MTRLDTMLDVATEDIDRVRTVLDDVLHRLRDGMAGQPKAQSYDSPRVNGHTTVTDENGDSMPSVSDPTGDAAIEMALGKDVATAQHKRISKLIHTIAHAAYDLHTECSAVQRRGPTAKERAETDGDNETAKGACEVCQRSEVYAPAIVAASNAKGNLPRFYRLCRWHLDFALSYGRLPNDIEEKRHHDGGRVRVRA